MGATQQALLAKSSGGDPLFANVAALVHFDEADGATSFADVTGGSWSALGNAQTDTAQSKWGGASLLLDGTGDLAFRADQAKYTLTGADFCVEAWIRFNGAPAGQQAIASHYNATGAQRAWGFYWVSNTLNLLTNNTGGTTPGNVTTTSSTWTPSGNTWYHVAVTRESNTVRFFVDGALISSHTLTSGIFNTNADFIIGRFAGGSDFNGWIDDFRFTVGNARYTAAFTAPTGPFPDSA